MSKSESLTRDSSTGPAVVALLDAPPRAACRVVTVAADHRDALAREGLSAGAEVDVERLVRLGGPLIVRLGRARLAVARSVARTVLVEPVVRP